MHSPNFSQSNFFGLAATVFALVAFAGNSVLCRLALGEQTIDAAGFTVIRMISGAVTMILVMVILKPSADYQFSMVFKTTGLKDYWAAMMLLAYAVFFSYAYVQLDTASGALILFATVQLSMMGYNLYKGHRMTIGESLGVVISIAGFVLLMLPGASQPPIQGFVLMVISGIAWAIYTLEGKKAKEPIQNTAENFIRAIPVTLVLLLLLLLLKGSQTNISWQGALYAVASGSITSALGYTIWYIALKQLSITQAAISQLSVPLIAALGAVVFVGEAFTSHLMLCSALILGGILLVTMAKQAS